jgi:hypothetical protein
MEVSFFGMKTKFNFSVNQKTLEEMRNFSRELFDADLLDRPDVCKMLILGYQQLRTAPAFFVPDTRHKIIKAANRDFGGSADKAVAAAIDIYLRENP